MSALIKTIDYLTEEEFLAGEEFTEELNEYVEGKVYAMASPTDTHEKIVLNIASALNQHLDGHPCQPFAGRMKLRMKYLNRTVHYIPDVMVACDKNPSDRRYREEPVALVEVLSPTTEGTDIREKMFAYLTITSLGHYVLVSQEKMEVTIYRRTAESWEVEVLTAPEDLLRFPDLGFSMPMSAIYKNANLG